MKVLHVGEYVQGGVATYIRNLIQHSECESIENYLICSNTNSEHKWSIRADRVTYYEYTRNLLNVYPAMVAIWKTIKLVQPDIIYCHSSWAGAFVRIPLLFKRKPCKIIYNAHGWAFLRDISSWKKWIYEQIERLLSFRTDCIINVSGYERNSAIKAHIPSNKLKLIYNGISIGNKSNKCKSNVEDSKINLLFVGRFDPQKGVDLLLEAMGKIHRKDIHLTLIGDNVVGGLNIDKKDTPNVTFLGWISNDKLYKYYEGCDAVIMPSRWEAFGLVAIEAMQYGKPVIASNRGALPELIVDKNNGYLVSINSIESLVECIDGLRKDSLKKMNVRAKEMFLEKYLVDRMIEDTILCYKE